LLLETVWIVVKQRNGRICALASYIKKKKKESKKTCSSETQLNNMSCLQVEGESPTPGPLLCEVGVVLT